MKKERKRTNRGGNNEKQIQGIYRRKWRSWRERERENQQIKLLRNYDSSWKVVRDGK